MKKFLYVCLLLIIITFTLNSCNQEQPSPEKETFGDITPEEHTHKYGEWTITSNASCTENGERERVCDCGEKETKTIKALGHKYNISTCEDIVCQVCNKLSKEQAHDFSVTRSDAPSLNASAIQVEKCSKCGEENSTVLSEKVEPQTLEMPVIYIDDIDPGAIPLYDLKKSDGEITVKYRYVSNSADIESFDCFCEIKIQGASSQHYPKKNFTVKFFEDEDLSEKLKVDLGWGKQTKYCMKANYIDSSHSRNIVAAKLFSEIVQTRDNINEGLTAAPNYGLIDGYPVAVYLNGEFHGLYTMNIPKDKWTFNMSGKEESREALLMADNWHDSVALKEEIGDSYEGSGWEVEHCSTDDDSWIKESFNELIRLLNCKDNDRIKQELPNHLDIEAAIDNMLFTYAISASDNVSKNVLWATYDGNVWIPSMYDMDGTFGIIWNGQPWGTTDPYNAKPTYPTISSSGKVKVADAKLYEVLISCYADEVEARWRSLRSSVLTLDNISKKFDDFFAAIPDIVYYSDQEKWDEIPYAKTNLANMYASVEQQLARLDDFFYNFNQ